MNAAPPLGRRVLAWGLLVLALIALTLLPMRLALGWLGLEQAGLSSAAISGSVWHGHLTAVHWGKPGEAALDLGDIDAALAPLPLLLGRAQMHFTRAGDGTQMPPLDGRIESGWGARSISGLTGSVAGSGGLALPIERIEFADVAVRFDGARCSAASGRLRVMLVLPIPGLEMRHGLSGTARCAGGRLLLPLMGESGMERITLSVAGDGRYAARLSIRSTDAILSAALAAAGFAPGPDGLAMQMRGTL